MPTQGSGGKNNGERRSNAQILVNMREQLIAQYIFKINTVRAAMSGDRAKGEIMEELVCTYSLISMLQSI